jgi:hypothetical protein
VKEFLKNPAAAPNRNYSTATYMERPAEPPKILVTTRHESKIVGPRIGSPRIAPIYYV